ncbi:MAG: CDP-diacylglycerol--serine O-phosphatidyltransferase [Bacteroidetes bacterium]|nr:CDP-diacylglycerol--serine O-phosphatidyltransferase [Bacteroidota bacterium]
MKITRAVVPSLFTVLNMFCGFMAIIHASKDDFISSAWFIILAAGFDSLDGVMARITKSSSQFGVEIDSLSDVVSFGAAPAFLVYQVHLHTLGGLGILISAFLMIFGGLRLARFNVQLVGLDKDHFVGLPIPASALTIASFIISYWNDTTGLGSAVGVLPWMSAGLGLLMVSKVKYDTLPLISRRAIRKEPWKFIFFALAIIVVFVTAGEAIFPLFVLFIALGIIRYIGTMVKHILRGEEKHEAEDAPEPTRIDI